MTDATKIRITADEFAQLPERNTFMELINGEIFMPPSPFARHQRVVRNLIRFIENNIPNGEVMIAPMDVHFDDYNVVQPDIFWLADNSDCVERDGYFYGATELVVEVHSKGTTTVDKREKFDLYEKHGVQEYWMLDPFADHIEVWQRVDDAFKRIGIFTEGDEMQSSALGKALTFDTIFSKESHTLQGHPMPHIFISYSRQDIDFARYVRSQLEHQGFSVWMDEKRLSAGEDWFDSIIAAVDKCVAFVAIMSPDAQKSHWVRSEILRALDQNKPTFPILLSGKVFPLLAALQYEDMRKGLNDILSHTFLENLRRATGISDTRQLHFEIVQGDVTDFACDVLVFKHAGSYLGADAMVASRLRKKGIPMEDLSDTLREDGDFFYIPTDDAIPAKHVLYIRTKNTGAFYYRDVREFSANAMNTLADEAPDTQHLATTVHGIRTQRQLDEGESVLAQIAGFIEQLQDWDAPPALNRITIVERDKDRVLRLRNAVQEFFEEVTYASPSRDAEWGYDLVFTRNVAEATPQAGSSDEKPYALTMMPDDESLQDLFFYGIQRPVHAMGFLCERLNPVHQLSEGDNASYVKPPVPSILDRIRYAQALIVDATDMTDLMHLYIGYAWGAAVPVYLISRREQILEFADELLVSDKIWQIEERLSQWFKSLE